MDPTQRFSDRVSDYVKYRPGYPTAIVADLIAAQILQKHSVLADVGSGTGLLSRLFLEHGRTVYGIEPNNPMREAGAAQLAAYPHFISIAGTAEATTLPDQSVDLIVAGQAFHWFDQQNAKREFQRILKSPSSVIGAPKGWAVIVWNERKVETSPFLQAYEAMMKRHSPDYEKVDHRRVSDAVMSAFFSPGTMVLRVYTNEQSFDLPGFRGRVMSSSYAPARGKPGHEGLMHEVDRIFAAHQRDGNAIFEYDTNVYMGKV